MKLQIRLIAGIVLLLVAGTACATPASDVDVPTNEAPAAVVLPTLTTTDASVTALVPITGHLMKPAENVPSPIKIVDDVDSSGTGPEGRAPYGDSYKLNRFERPFLQDMTYVADLDIYRFSLSEDADWYYVSLRVAGSDPNNVMEINYGAEIDLNADGAGDYMIWTHPPYTTEWNTGSVQVYQDSNRDTGGPSSLQADTASNGNGYDSLVFDGSAEDNADPDLAWVRLSQDISGLVQIAFKKTLTGPSFLVGVVSDAGLKDLSKYDYADHVTEADAGSPVKNNKYFPLKSLYAVDNTCLEAIGIHTTGYEPKLCQPILQPVNKEKSNDDPTAPSSACNPPPDCGGGPYNPDTCQCE
jgi:hypothetical protein